MKMPCSSEERKTSSASTEDECTLPMFRRSSNESYARRSARLGNSQNGAVPGAAVVQLDTEAKEGLDIVDSSFSDAPDGDHRTSLNPLALDRTGNGADSPPRNEFSQRKTLAHTMMDVALMMANISQLRVLLTSGGSESRFYYPLLTLIILSLVFQMLFAVIIVIIWAREKMCPCHRFKSRGNPTHPSPVSLPPASPVMTSPSLTEEHACENDAKNCRDEREHDFVVYVLHCISVVLVFLITVMNMFITGLGLETVQNVPSSSAPGAKPVKSE